MLTIIKSKLQAKYIYITIMTAYNFCAVCSLKKAQVFFMFMANIYYSAKKKTRA